MPTSKIETRAKIDLAELERPALEAWLDAAGARRFHAAHIFQWLYRRGVSDPAAMTDLSRALRETLAAETRLTTPSVVERRVSADGTAKFLLRLKDGRAIESVYIPDTPAQTFCISTQVGCAMACGFCLTGRMGIVRNLTPGEIVGQVRVLARETSLLGQRYNIVLMGMGEPLHNYDHTMAALRLMADEHGLAISPRRVTLSTVGIVPGLERLAREPWIPNLAISLHATRDAQRSAIVPVNRKYPLADLLEACRQFPLKHRNRITFEYVLLAGVNDTLDDARRLVALLHGIKAKVNLLALNAAPGIPFERPSDERVDAFAAVLAGHHVTVSVRKSRGRDIRAACGQLIVEGGSGRTVAQRAAEALASTPVTPSL